MRASDIAFIAKILQMCYRKNGIAIFSLTRTYFHIKKRAKRPNTFLRPANWR